MIYSIMAVICISVVLYFSSCLIVERVVYDDEDSAVGNTMIIISVIYFLGLLSGWWMV